MLPKELEDIFNEYTEDDYSLYVTKADYSGDVFLLEFILNVEAINTKAEINQEWMLQARGYRKSNISFEFAPIIELKDDHPLLWEFTDVQCELYFSGQCKDPAKLFYNLFLTHRATFGRHRCFNIYSGLETTYFKTFEFGNGLLTQGSKKLMALYADCLSQNGLEYTFIGERPAEFWDGEQFTLNTQDLNVVIIGETFIIAKEFAFVRIDHNSR